MILSYQIPEWCTYQRAALALHDVEREIDNRRNSRHPIERKILPRLIEKRERLAAVVAPLKAAAEAAERRAQERLSAAPVHSPISGKPSTVPHCSAGDHPLDIPDFLRRPSK